MNRKKIEELLSRGLDGELSPAERGELDRLLAVDPELKKLEGEWTSYAEALRAQPVPAAATSAEAAWADVQRAIRLDSSRNEPVETGVFRWRLGWAGAIIALVLLGFSTIALRQVLTPAPQEEQAGLNKDVQVEFVESDLPGASPMVYEDVETGWTVIWVAGLDENPAAPAGT